MLESPEVYHGSPLSLETLEMIKTLVMHEVYHGSSLALDITKTIETMTTNDNEGQ